MLKQVHFAGIKSLLDVTVDLEPFTVLVGPNGCGKSTLLDQTDLLCQCSVPAPTESLVVGHAGRLLEDSDSIRRSGWNGTMKWSGVSDRGVLQVQMKDGSRPYYERISVRATTLAKDTNLNADNADKTRKPLELSLTESFGWRALRLRLAPRAIAAPSALEPEGVKLAETGLGLPTLLSLLKLNDTGSLQNIEADLQTVVPNFERLGFQAVAMARGGGFALTLSFKGVGFIPAYQVSDGTLLALALLTATHTRDLPSLILMDDIDHGLHLGAQYAMIKAIRAVMAVRPELQVVCTTHSPVLLDSFDVAEVRVMALDGQGRTRVKPLAQHPKLDSWRAGFSAGELWANLGEDWVIDG